MRFGHGQVLRRWTVRDPDIDEDLVVEAPNGEGPIVVRPRVHEYRCEQRWCATCAGSVTSYGTFVVFAVSVTGCPVCFTPWSSPAT